MPELLAAIRPAGQDFPVLLHIVGATVVFGALLASAISLALARGEIRLLRLGYFSLLLVGLPGLILMRLAANGSTRSRAGTTFQTSSKPDLAQHRVHRRGLRRILFLLALVVGGIGISRLRSGKGGAGLLKVTMVSALVLASPMSSRCGR